MVLIINNFEHEENDEEKFNQLYNSFYRYTYKICYNIIKDTDPIEDLVHDVFLIIYQTMSAIKNDISAKAWISTIARNTAINYLNHRIVTNKYIVEIDDEIMYSTTSDNIEPSRIVIDQDTVNNIYEEIKKSDKKYADVLLLKYKFDFDVEEIAKLLGIKPKTAYQRITRGREKLKRALFESQKGVK